MMATLEPLVSKTVFSMRAERGRWMLNWIGNEFHFPWIGARKMRLLCFQTRSPASVFKALAFLLLASLQTACMAGPLGNVYSDYALDEESGTGLLLGSVTFDGWYTGHSVYFTPRDAKTQEKWQERKAELWVEVGEDYDETFLDLGMKGDLFVTELPAGRYLIYTWAIGSDVYDR